MEDPNTEAGGGVNFYSVPEGCIAAITALTTPKDACTLAAVSRLFSSASDSDLVWEKFLPSDCEAIIARSDGGEAMLAEIRSKKELYMRLANRPLLVDEQSKSFWVEKSSGKKCWMISARSLSIIWSDTPRQWRWTSTPESRFSEVAELIRVSWLEIRGKMKTKMLSRDTRYAAYLVFKTTEEAYGVSALPEGAYGLSAPPESWIKTPEGKTKMEGVYLMEGDDWSNFPSRGLMKGFYRGRLAKGREDGWKEVKIGEIWRGGEEEMVVHLGKWKKGLVVEGMEIRPVVEEEDV